MCILSILNCITFHADCSTQIRSQRSLKLHNVSLAQVGDLIRNEVTLRDEEDRFLPVLNYPITLLIFFSLLSREAAGDISCLKTTAGWMHLSLA